MEAETNKYQLSLEQEKAIKEGEIRNAHRGNLIEVTQLTDCHTPLEEKIKMGHKPFSCPRAINGDGEWAKYAALKRSTEMGYNDCYTNCNSQYIHTPFSLCEEIIGTTKKYITSFIGLRIMTLNMEVIEVLVNVFGVEEKQITFITDCPAKENVIKAEFTDVEVIVENFNKFLEGSSVMSMKKFDCVIGNPPYQDVENKSLPLWQAFTKKSFSLCKEGGYIVLIHPSNWRKPGHELFEDLKRKGIKYLELHSSQDGQKTFGCGTRYDWYVLCNKELEQITTVVDENGEKHNMDLKCLSFLTNSGFEQLNKIIAREGEEKLDVCYFRSTHGTDKAWMRESKGKAHKYTCVHSTNTDGPVFWYSSHSSEHFGTPKVIFGLGGWRNPIIDINGEYGVTQNCFYVKVTSKQEAESLVAVMKDKKAQAFFENFIWSGFAIDWRAFCFLKKDFWKEFI